MLCYYTKQCYGATAAARAQVRVRGCACQYSMDSTALGYGATQPAVLRGTARYCAVLSGTEWY
eukprot:2024735-Rhodomonas_salina.2